MFSPAQFVPLQLDTAEPRYGAELANIHTPKQAFKRWWAITLPETVLRQLETKRHGEGKAEQFAVLKQCLVSDRALLPYDKIAQVVRMSQGAVKVTLPRLQCSGLDLSAPNESKRQPQAC